MPRPANRSSTFPIPTRSIPASASRSSSVGPTGSIEKSLRRGVRWYAPGVPVNGRAITRLTACSPTSIPRATAHAWYSSSSGTVSSCAAIWKTESAEVYTIHFPVRWCSLPSSAMIAVPEAALLPNQPRPVRRANSSSRVVGKPFGYVRNGSPVDARQPGPESGQELALQLATPGRELLQRDCAAPPVCRADESRYVPHGGGPVPHVQHRQIHRHEADDRAGPPAQ